jgi:hypothetical protein
MEATLMKVLGVISTTAMFLLLGATIPAFAQEEHHEESAKPAAKQEQVKPQKQEQQAKPAKQEQAKPEKQQQQAKPQKQEQQAKSQEQNQKQTQQQAKGQQQQEKKQQQQQQTKTQQNQEKSQQRQEQQANGHAQQSQAQYARNGQKDSRGHEYNESHFGPNHHARFESTGGREYDGRREYSYGGYWFYAGAYPPWFYQRDVYFVMGPDGLWYAVAYNDPSLTFQVNIE